MIVTITKSKIKKKKVSTDELLSKTLVQIALEECEDARVENFDGKTLTIDCGEKIDLEIDDNELIKSSIESIVKKKLNLRGSVNISIKK